MIKKIISDQEGLYRNPFDAVVIKGDKTHTNFISKYVDDPFVAIGHYGAEVVPAGTPETTMPGNTIGEFSFNTNQMNYAQEGGASSQQQQIEQQVAQMLQQGATPPQVMQQLVDNGIPSKQAEQLLTSVMQQMQAAMAEQQQMQNEDMGGQEQMPMAMEGGRACIDCEEQFPQAQNLNWFYKAEGGEAFPQANPYPHMYADGGEAFPQAQTYLPYDRGSQPRGNFMFEYGGTTDIEQAYQMMKRGGMDMNPTKKKGGKFTQESFEEYVMRNGGDLPMHQWQQSQTGFGFGQPDATQVYRPNIQLPSLQQVPNSQQVSPNPFLINNQQSFANQYPGAMQNIMNATQPMGQQQRQSPAPTTAAARTAGSASGVKRAPAATPRDNSVVKMMTPRPAIPIPRQAVDATVQSPQYANQTQNTGTNQTQNTGANTQANNTQTNNTNSNQRQGYFNPMQAYLAGQNLPRLLGNKAAAGLGLLSMLPGAGSALSTGYGYGDGLLGRRDKFKANYVGPDGSRENVKVKGRESIAKVFGMAGNQQQQVANTNPQTGPNPNVFPYRLDPGDDPATFTNMKQMGGDLNWKYSTFDPNAGMEDFVGANAFQSGIFSGMTDRKEQEKLRNQETVSSGIAMGPIASKTPGNAAVGTTNAMGMVNPFMSGQQGNFGQGAYQSSMLTARYGGNILDEFEDGGVYDMDGMSEEEIRNFVDAIYAAGGSVEYL